MRLVLPTAGLPNRHTLRESLVSCSAAAAVPAASPGVPSEAVGVGAGSAAGAGGASWPPTLIFLKRTFRSSSEAMFPHPPPGHAPGNRHLAREYKLIFANTVRGLGEHAGGAAGRHLSFGWRPALADSLF